MYGKKKLFFILYYRPTTTTYIYLIYVFFSDDDDDVMMGKKKINKLQGDGKLGKSYEVPRKFTIIDQPFSIENGLLTPKLSMKRNDISKRYNELIESMYTN